MSFLYPYLPPHQVSSLLPNTMNTFQSTFWPQLQWAQITNSSIGNILFSWIPWPSQSSDFPPISLVSLLMSYFHFSSSTSPLNTGVAQGLVVDVLLTLFLPCIPFLWLHTTNQKMIIRFLSLVQIPLLSSILIYPAALVTSSLWYITGRRNSTCQTLNSWLSPHA